MKALLNVRSPSDFVLSPSGQSAQKQVWEQTIALLKKEMADFNTSTAE